MFDLTMIFCKQYIQSWKLKEQMEGAARGGKQNTTHHFYLRRHDDRIVIERTRRNSGRSNLKSTESHFVVCNVAGVFSQEVLLGASPGSSKADLRKSRPEEGSRTS